MLITGLLAVPSTIDRGLSVSFNSQATLMVAPLCLSVYPAQKAMFVIILECISQITVFSFDRITYIIVL